jgi:lipopolysaccharide/colanic/teichoic acid biosynthesis glycosyltransferase
MARPRTSAVARLRSGSARLGGSSRPRHARSPPRPEPAPPPASAESLAARYSRLAGEQFEPRTVDVVLRGLDIAIGATALVAAAPLIASISLAVRATSGSPVLYRGQRVGRAGAVFTMYKFRTLTPDAETRLGPFSGGELTQLTESEVTDVGRVLRTTQLDELPQLWNVLRGDMSIVGPRPIRPTFFEELCAQIPQYWQRLVVRPGMTGFAQIRLTRDDTWSEKLAHDLEYIADRSVSLYARAIVETGWRVLRRTAAAIAGRPVPPPAS